jgi:hypothetical protein
MKPNPRSILVVLGLLVLALTSSCASLGTPEDQRTAAVLWGQDMRDYRSWAQFDGFPGIQKSKSDMHGTYVATYINGAAAGSPDDLPPGSVIVKENFSSADPSTINGITVMKKIPGYDPDNGDWFWARFTPGGDLTHAGKVAMCADCHFDAGNDDYVFLND